MVAMLLRKTPIMVGAKTPWSTATRARISAFLLGSTTRRCRNLNHVVAAGPNTAARRVSFGGSLPCAKSVAGVRARGGLCSSQTKHSRALVNGNGGQDSLGSPVTTSIK